MSGFVDRVLPIDPIFAGERRAQKRGYNLPLIGMFGVALFAALIPVFYPIPYGGEMALVLIGAAVYGFGLVVTVHTLMIAVGMTARDLEPARFELFALTGIDARRYTLGRWRAILRRVIGWHVLAGLLKVGVALAAAQVVYGQIYVSQHTPSSSLTNWLNLNYSPVDVLYNSQTQQSEVFFRIGDRWTFEQVDPYRLKSFTVIAVVITLGVIECAMTAALGMAAARLRGWRAVFAFVLRFSIWAVAAGAWVGLIWILQMNNPEGEVWTWERYDTWILGWFFNGGVSSFADGGTYVAGRIFSPYTPGWFHIIHDLLGIGIGVIFFKLVMVSGLLATENAFIRRGGLRKHPSFTRRLWQFARQSINNPFLQDKSRQLGEALPNGRVQMIGLCVLWGLVFMICLSPLVWFIDHTAGWRLTLIAVIGLGANSLIGVRTLIAATMMGGDFHPANDALLRLAGVSSYQRVISSWWAVVRWAFPAHFLALPLKIGVAYGVTQFLYAGFLEPEWLFSSFNYRGWGLMPQMVQYEIAPPEMCIHFSPTACYSPYFPALDKVLMASLIIALYTMLEIGLFASIGIVCSVWFKGRSIGNLISAFGVRIGLNAFLTGVLMMFDTLVHFFSRTYYQIGWTDYRILERLNVLAQSTLTTFVDGGVMASTYWTQTHYWGLFTRLTGTVLVIVITFTGAVLYLIFTFACLRIAIWRAGREGSRG